MINEGDPTPPRFDSPIDTCSTKQYNDVLQKMKSEEQQEDEKRQRFVDNFSAAKSNSYVRTWYVFYAADNTIKQISTLSMKSFPNTDYYTTDYCCNDYRPADYCSTDYCACSIDYSPADYCSTAINYTTTTDYRSTANRAIDSRSTAYQCMTFYPTHIGRSRSRPNLLDVIGPRPAEGQ
jgi:hypothetical protein